MSEETTVIDSSEEVSLPQPKKRDLFFTKQVDQDSIAALTESIPFNNLSIFTYKFLNGDYFNRTD